jgi:hypothetical protein
LFPLLTLTESLTAEHDGKSYNVKTMQECS